MPLGAGVTISAACVYEGNPRQLLRLGLLPSSDMLSLPLEFVAAVARAFYLCVEDFIFILRISGQYNREALKHMGFNIRGI
ncbi:hypothetical protein Tco_0913368 [Tanacetum coccineum]